MHGLTVRGEFAMSSLKASVSGLERINYHRNLKGWTKQSAMWASEAEVSEATLKRFWQQKRIRHRHFVAIVQSVGMTNWESIAELAVPKMSTFFKESDLSAIISYQTPEMPQYYGLIEARIQGCNIMYSDRIWNQLKLNQSTKDEAKYCMV
jgi:hypothetical protein